MLKKKESQRVYKMKKTVFIATLFMFLSACLYLGGCSNNSKTTAVPTAEITETPPVLTDTPQPTATPLPSLNSVARIELTTSDKKGIDTRDFWKKGTLRVGTWDSVKEQFSEMTEYECEYKGRGNSTWNYKKKPFTVKFPEKVPLLGLEKGKKFCFVANWLDRSAIRNSVTYYIANLFTALNYSDEYLNTGWKWSPSCDYADVYIDGQYAGIYLIADKIQIAGNRLELVEQNEEGTLPITERGLLFEMSTDGRNWETSEYLDRIKNSKGFIPYNVKEPDYLEDLTPAEQQQVRDFIDEVEDIIFAPKSDAAWEKICETLDITSFADFWIVQALASNGEPEHPKSIFMYKNNDSPDLDAKNADANGGKLYAGPVWDFDWGTYGVYAAGLEFPTDTFYYGALFEYEEFRKKVAERFELIKPALTDDVPRYIDELTEKIAPSIATDDRLYPWRTRSGNRVNYDSFYAYSTSIVQFKSYLRQRVTAVEKQITKLNAGK